MKKSVLLFVAMFFSIATTAMAVPYQAEYQEAGVGNFDRIDIFMTSNNNTFTPPGQEFKPANGWVGTLVTPTYTIAHGPALNNLVWYVDFAEQITSTFDIFVFSGSTLVDSGIGVYSGGNSWNETQFFAMSNPNDTYIADLSAVPEPGTMMLLGIGMLGLAVYGKRRMNKEA